MKISIIVPIYNELSPITRLLKRIESIDLEKEIIIVDDGSTFEATQEMLNQIEKREGTTLVKHEINQGKGAAICTALQYASGDAVIIQDADTEYYPEDIPRLIEIFEANEAKAVYGARDLSERSWYMLLGNRFLTFMTNVIYQGRLRDMESCYKLIDREVMLSLDLESKRFEIEAEISAKLLRLGVQIYQCPIQYSVRKEGKKLTPLDGLPALYTLFKYAFWKK